MFDVRHADHGENATSDVEPAGRSAEVSADAFRQNRTVPAALPAPSSRSVARLARMDGGDIEFGSRPKSRLGWWLRLLNLRAQRQRQSQNRTGLAENTDCGGERVERSLHSPSRLRPAIGFAICCLTTSALPVQESSLEVDPYRHQVRGRQLSCCEKGTRESARSQVVWMRDEIRRGSRQSHVAALAGRPDRIAQCVSTGLPKLRGSQKMDTDR